MTDRFPEHARAQVERALAAIPADVARDVYVVALLASVEGDDDGRRPVIDVAWNTTAHLARKRAERPQAAGNMEWNAYSFANRSAATIGDSNRDPRGAILRRRWIDDELGQWYDDPPRDDSVDRDIEIWKRTLELTVAIAAGLHRSGLIAQTFGKPIPVFIDAIETDEDVLAELNRAANPPALHDTLDRLVRKR